MDQLLQLRNQPSVEGGCQRPARRIEPRRQLVTTGNGQSSESPDEVARGDLVARIADGEVTGYGEGGDVRSMAVDRGLERDQVKRSLLVAGRCVAAGNEAHGIVAQGTPQIGPIQR